jgi:hypothetical protein
MFIKYKPLQAFISSLFLIVIILTSAGLSNSFQVYAADDLDKDAPPPVVEVINPYYTVEKITLEDGTTLQKGIINGPPNPLPEYEDERLASIQPLPSRGTIPSFPSYNWVFGCSAVSGAMIAAHYDNNGYSNMYAGPTSGGLMPQTDTSWPTWYDGYATYPNNPLIASHIGVDGRVTKGSIDDYWVKYGSTASDPYITGSWTQHTWSDAIGDYMKTSQSAYSNTDGSTSFYNWTDSGDPLTCAQMEGYGIHTQDGTYGRKLFYEARGYSVSDCYSQNTDNNFSGGFSLSDFQSEIDAGHPVLLNLEGHSIVGYGYSGSTVYIRDTWDNDPSQTYTMPWGGSYLGMALQSVSIVKLNSISVPPSAPTGISASDGTFADKVRVSWNASAGATYYKVYRNTTNSTSGAIELPGSPASSPYDDFNVMINLPYYYWVKACNTAGCSDCSSSDSGYAQSIVTVPNPPANVLASDGTYPDKVQISWTASTGATHYKIFRNTSNVHTGEMELSSAHPASPFDDFSAAPDVTYTYWVKACNTAGCSNYSLPDTGYAQSIVTIPNPPANVLASDGSYPDKVQISWTASAGATHYKIFRNTSNVHTGEMELSSSHPASPYDDFGVIQDVPYTYWVKACNTAGCSNYSLPDSGFATSAIIFYELYLPLIMKQEYVAPVDPIENGDFEQGQVGWSQYSSGGYELIYSDVSWAHTGSWIAYLGGYHDAIDQLYQDVTITASQPYINFYGIINSEDVCGYDHLYIGFGDDFWYIDLCSENNTSEWVHIWVDFSDYIGSTETLYFIVETNGSLFSDFYLDTVFLSASSPAAKEASTLIEAAPENIKVQRLTEGAGFKEKDINR